MLGCAVNLREAQCMRVPLQLATQYGIGKHVVIIDDRMGGAFSLRRVIQQQSAKLVNLGAEIIAVGLPGQINLVDAIGDEDAVEPVEATELIVALDDAVPAELPPAREREETMRFDAAAPAVVFLIIGGCAR